MKRNKLKHLTIAAALLLSALFAVLAIPTEAISPTLSLTDSDKGITGSYSSDFEEYSGGEFNGFARHYNWDTSSGQDFGEGKLFSRTKATASSWTDESDINTYARYSRDVTKSSYKTDYTSTGTAACLTDFWIQNSSSAELMASYDFVVIDLDICADRWVLSDGSLSETYQTGALPGYCAGTGFSLCFRYNGLSKWASGQNYVYIKYDSSLKQYYLQCYSDTQVKYYLPNQTDVWTHLTWVVEIDNSSCTPSENATTTTPGSLLNSKIHVYVDGVYFYTMTSPLSKLTSSTSINVAEDYASNKIPRICVETLRMNWQFADETNLTPSSTSKNLNTTIASYGIDNYAVNYYKNGYSGDLASHPLDTNKSTPLYNCDDVVYSKSYVYSSGNTPAATVTKNGTTTPYYFMDSAFSAATEGSVLTLYSNPASTLNVNHNLTVVTNGYSLPFTTGSDIVNYDYDENSKTYTFRTYCKVSWHLGDEILTEYYEKGAIPSFKGSYPEHVLFDGTSYRTLGGWTAAVDSTQSITFSALSSDAHFYIRRSLAIYYSITSADGTVKKIEDEDCNNILSAVKYAEDGDRFTLMSDLVLNKSIVTPTDKTVYFDLAGHSLTFTATGVHIYNADGTIKRWDGGKDASFQLSNGTTLYLYSSLPGATVYNSYYNYTTKITNGQAIVNCGDNIVNSKLYMGEVTIDGTVYSGDNITTYSANLLYHQGNSSNHATLKGGKYYRVISDNRAMIVSNNGAVIKISEALLASNAGKLISTYKSGTAASLTDITFEGCTLYTPDTMFYEFNTGASLTLNECYVISNIKPGASAGSVLIGSGTFINPASAVDSYVTYEGVSVKAKNSIKLNLEFISFSYNENAQNPELATYNKASSEIVTLSTYTYTFSTVKATAEDYQTVKWIYKDSTTTELWYKGSIPDNPITPDAPTATYKFVLEDEIVAAVGGTVKTYEYVQKVAYTIYSNITLSSNIIYNVYIPKSMSSYINGVYYDGTEQPLTDITVINGNEYYTFKIPIIASQGAKDHYLTIKAIGYQGRAFDDNYVASIPKYAKSILEGDYDEDTVKLVNATLAYIKSAGEYFGTDTSIIGSVPYADATPGVAPDAVPDAIKAVFSGVQFSLNEQIALRINLRDGVSSVTVTLNYMKSGNRIVETVTESSFKTDAKGTYYELPLRAADLLKDIKITVGDAEYTYSFDNYIYNTSKTPLAASTKTLMTLLYNMRAYGAVAEKFVNESPFADMSIAGNNIGAYQIVANTAAELNAAAIIKNQIYLKTGYSLNIVSSANGPAIRINMLDYTAANDFIATVADGDLVISCAYASFIEDAAITFSNEYIVAAESGFDFGNGFAKTYSTPYISYTDFGAAADGVTDDFAAMKLTHQHANSKGYTVRVNSGTYYVGNTSGAFITVKTDVIWTGATIIIDDSAVAYNQSSRNVDIFKFQSDYTIKTFLSGSQIVNALNEGGLTSSTKKIDYAPGYNAMLIPYDENHKAYIRYGLNGNEGSAQSELIIIDGEGNIDPNTSILLDYDTITKILVCNVDDTPITAKGGKFITVANRAPRMYTYYRRGINIYRSNVTIDGLEHVIQGESEDYGAPYTGFFTIQYSNNFLAKNCILQSHLTNIDCDAADYGVQQNNTSMGSYDIGGSYFNNARFVNCTESNFYADSSKTTVRDKNKYWGIMGTNYCKNITYENSVLSRLDAHAGVYNITITGSKLIWVSLIGGGTANITDSTIYNNTIIALRSDYGSTWHGDVNIKNVHVVNTDTVTVISGGWVDHYFGYKVYLPTNINIDNITLASKKSVYVLSSFASSDVRNHLTNPLTITKKITIKNNNQNLTYYSSSGSWLKNLLTLTYQ